MRPTIRDIFVDSINQTGLHRLRIESRPLTVFLDRRDQIAALVKIVPLHASQKHKSVDHTDPQQRLIPP